MPAISSIPTPVNMYTQFRPIIRGKLWLLLCIHIPRSRYLPAGQQWHLQSERDLSITGMYIQYRNDSPFCESFREPIAFFHNEIDIFQSKFDILQQKFMIFQKKFTMVDVEMTGIAIGIDATRSTTPKETASRPDCPRCTSSTQTIETWTFPFKSSV